MVQALSQTVPARAPDVLAPSTALGTTPSAFIAPTPQGKGRESQNDRVLKTIKKWLRAYRNHDLVPAGYLIGSKSLLKKAELEDPLTRKRAEPRPTLHEQARAAR